MVAPGGKFDDESSETGVLVAGPVSITIHCTDGSKFLVRTGLGSTVGEFKVAIAQKCDLPAKQQRLIYNGRILKEDLNLASYGLQDEHVVHMVGGFQSDTSTSGISNANPGVGGPEHKNSPGDVGTSSGSGVFGFDGRAASEFEVELSQLEQMQNPNLLNDIVSRTLAFQSLVNNPGVIQNMIMGNPSTHEIIDQNPEFAHIMYDRDLQQITEIARNLELMTGIINFNSSTSNSNSTEGLNILRPMHQNMQEPTLSGPPDARETWNSSTLNPFAALLRRHGRDQLHDQLTTMPSTGSTTMTAAATGPLTLNTSPFANAWTQSTENGGTLTNASMGASHTRTATVPTTNDMLNPSQCNQFLGNPMENYLSDLAVTNQHNIMKRNFSPFLLQELPAEQYFSSLLAELQSTERDYRTSGATGNRNSIAVDSLVDLFNSLGSLDQTGPNTRSVPLEQFHASQLSQLQETDLHAGNTFMWLRKDFWGVPFGRFKFFKFQVYLVCFALLCIFSYFPYIVREVVHMHFDLEKSE